MKKLIVLIAAIFSVFQMSFAAVNYYHAMNIMKGDYQFTDPMTGEKVEFSISNKEKVTMKENDAFYFANATALQLGNDLGPQGLTFLTVMLAGGSDEQTSTLVIRLFPRQNYGDSSETGLLDVVYLENDGPNEGSYAESYKNVKVLKKNKKTKKYEALTRS